VIASLALAPAAALGQNASELPTTDLNPPSSAAPPGGGAYYPGMPLPPPPQPGAPAGAPPGQPGAAPGGTSRKTSAAPLGRIITDSTAGAPPAAAEAPAEEGEGGGEPPAAPTEVHVVKKGDTLWDLSAFYFHNAWAWPKLWSYNPSITNPHWIYPGDIIHLGAPLAAPVAVAPAQPTPEAPARKITRNIMAPTSLMLRQTGFVEPGELDAAGKIVGSKEEKLMLATLDEAYVQLPSDRRIQPGDRMTVYKVIRPLVHPVSGKTLGHIVQIFGDVEVKSITNNNIARVLIIDSDDPIERGFRVGPVKRQFKVVDPRPNTQDLTGVVVATVHPRELVAAEQLVFLDRGKKDGVEVGNRFQVVRRGDGYQPLRNRGKPIDDHRFPRETIGEVLVLDVRDAVSTGFMLMTTKEAQVGDRVETHRGY
jgi:hypothetical protein